MTAESTGVESNTDTASGRATVGAALSDLLVQTSRTFALSIPLLPARLREQVMVAYLLFRLADTIEDEVDLPAGEKASLLRGFATGVSGGGGDGAVELLSGLTVKHEGYARLLSESEIVIERLAELPGAPREAITRHLVRTAKGMADHLDGLHAGRDLAFTLGYCYTVAGIVGELCTELFVLHDPPLARVSDRLLSLAPGFGEGLQLVNILRDLRDDADAGRCFTPSGAGRFAELCDQARRSLHTAIEYVSTLEEYGADAGTVAFNTLNTALAFETLALVEKFGPGSKMRRSRIEAVYVDITAGVDQGSPLTPTLLRFAEPTTGMHGPATRS